jgi:hypothetical protein
VSRNVGVNKVRISSAKVAVRDRADPVKTAKYRRYIVGETAKLTWEWKTNRLLTGAGTGDVITLLEYQTWLAHVLKQMRDRQHRH